MVIIFIQDCSSWAIVKNKSYPDEKIHIHNSILHTEPQEKPMHYEVIALRPLRLQTMSGNSHAPR